ncbi:MAG: Asp-tRNA(Asn)/Glu-tRNA(Gln) amidotransferase subunit GatC [Verrucomicrobiales bacterium]
MPELNVRYVADLARLALSEAEVALYQEQLSHILSHVDKLTELNVDGIEPSAHALPAGGALRPDEARPELCLGQEATLSNAPQRWQDQFRVPKVVE